MSDEVSNPYVGPRTFEEEDSEFFFGRDREARNLLSFVISEPLVLFYAQSGAGKSSLLNTRIIPGLRDEGFEVLPRGRVSGTLPAGIKEVANIYAFNLIISLDRTSRAGMLTHTTLTQFLKASAAGRDESLRAEQEQYPEHERDRVLIIDQFEEIVTTHMDRWPERETFFRQLSQAIQDDPHLWVVLAMREDHVTALDPYASLLPGKLQARFHMQRLEGKAAMAAVEKPAARGGRRFVKAASKALVDNLRQIRVPGQADTQTGQFVEPVQLQVVCYQLWENLKEADRDEITEEDIERLGDVDTALAQFYESAVADVLRQANETEIAVRNWFEKELITEAETRGNVYRGSEKTAELDNQAVDFLESRFLLRSVNRAGGIWYELVHDRLVKPILQANQAWRNRQSPLIQTALAWHEAGKDEEKLFVGAQLQQALYDVRPGASEPLVAEFLEASQEADKRRQEEEYQRQRDLERAQTLAAEQQQRAESEARSARLQRWLFAAAAAVLLLLVGIAVAFTTVQSLQAETERERLELTGTAAAAVSTAEESTREANAAATATRAEATAVIEQATRVAAEATATFQACVQDDTLVDDWIPAMGCALGDARIVWSAWEPFQNSQHMFWREDKRIIYVFYQTGDGPAWESFADDWLSPTPLPELGDVTPEASLLDLSAPLRGFGYLWRTNNDVRSRLGWATNVELGFCVLIQDFENGSLLRTDLHNCKLGQHNNAQSLDFGLLSIRWYQDNGETRWELACSTCLVEEGQLLVAEGQVLEAVALYEAARDMHLDKINFPLEISWGQWNQLCLWGSLWGFATDPDIGDACEQAVTGSGGNGLSRDSRGMFLALNGDLAGALEDFQFYVDWSRFAFPRESTEKVEQRRGWIESLGAGRNPFDDALLADLRDQFSVK